MELTKIPIQTEDAPAPIGPYNQAIQVGPWLYTSGQIAINPATGEVEGETVEDQTELVLANLKAVLAAAELRKEDVVKTTIFIANMDDFPKVNEVYGRVFDGKLAPARSCVEVSRLPKNVLVEIEAIALRNSS